MTPDYSARVVEMLDKPGAKDDVKAGRLKSRRPQIFASEVGSEAECRLDHSIPISE
jgi:hypothetical protein